MLKNPDSPHEGPFASQFRHEARTLLNHTTGYSELLPDPPPGSSGPFWQALRTVKSLIGLFKTALVSYVDDLDQGSADETGKQAAYGALFEFLDAVMAFRNAKLPDGAGAEELAAHDDARRIHEAVNALTELIGEREAAAQGVMAEQPAAELPRAKRSGRMLVIDDDESNRDLLSRHLERQGHVVCQAVNAQDGYRILAQAPFDVVFLDVLMPVMNGFQFLETLRADPVLREQSVIVISALEDRAAMARCIELGAEDYLLRDFDPLILKARIDSLLEKKRFKRESELARERLAETQKRLAAELMDAAEYVRTLLPRRAYWDDVAADWEFLPSLSLGGDSFSYWRLSDGRLAVFLIDVSGHGIEAALLSVTVMNFLKAMGYEGLDYGLPGRVLSRLNRSFRIEDQNNMFFTAWYGVYDPAARTLTYATGGAPPAILARPNGDLDELAGDGPLIGVDDTADFSDFVTRVEPGSNLYLFSDGLFEVRRRDGSMLPWEDFLRLIAAHHRECALAPSCLSPIKRIVNEILELSSKDHFEDDVSIVELAFHA